MSDSKTARAQLGAPTKTPEALARAVEGLRKQLFPALPRADGTRGRSLDEKVRDIPTSALRHAGQATTLRLYQFEKELHASTFEQRANGLVFERSIVTMWQDAIHVELVRRKESEERKREQREVIAEFLADPMRRPGGSEGADGNAITAPVPCPDDLRVTRKQIAWMCGVDETTATRWTKKYGMTSIGQDGKAPLYDWRAVVMVLKQQKRAVNRLTKEIERYVREHPVAEVSTLGYSVARPSDGACAAALANASLLSRDGTGGKTSVSVCERCQKSPKRRGERFCGRCAKAVMKNNSETGITGAKRARV